MQKVVWGAPSFWIERFPLYWGIDQGFFAKQSIDPDGDVELMPLGEDYGKLDLFVDGRVDAAFVVEPQLARGEHEGLLRVIDRVADYFSQYQWGIILASEAWLQDQGDLLGRLMQAFRQACRSIINRPGQTTDLGSRVFEVTPEVFERALLRDLPRWDGPKPIVSDSRKAGFVLRPGW